MLAAQRIPNDWKGSSNRHYRCWCKEKRVNVEKCNSSVHTTCSLCKEHTKQSENLTTRPATSAYARKCSKLVSSFSLPLVCPVTDTIFLQSWMVPKQTNLQLRNYTLLDLITRTVRSVKNCHSEQFKGSTSVFNNSLKLCYGDFKTLA